MVTLAERQTDQIRRVRDFRRAVFDRIRKNNRRLPGGASSLARVRKVAVILAGPRSGSSLLFSILRRHPCCYAPSGEITPFYKLNGLSADTNASDEIPPAFLRPGQCPGGLSDDLLSDLSTAASPRDIWNDEQVFEQYVDDLCLRLILQWPQAGFRPEALRTDILRALGFSRRRRSFVVEEFYLDLLGVLAGKYRGVHPAYYDLPAALIKKRFPGLKIPAGPPHKTGMIEEPPFILLAPRKKTNAADLRERTLLLKTSTDSYRMPFMSVMFPNADIKIIHLTRNPAASVNGLYDGWRHHGFFSRNLRAADATVRSAIPRGLEITGYSDRFAWGRWWWKYDLPPGWQDHVRDSLQEVCAFQWLASNRAILEYVRASGADFLRVRHEDVTRDARTRSRALKALLDFLGFGAASAGDLKLDKLPVVQATRPPEHYRWKKRREMIQPLCGLPDVAEISGALGYDIRHKEEWL
ncbi:MAG: hypothetical protein PHS61_02580 [Candidatus Omnitrophica bacterium]|nr:hypothetical protein [Candidatus Omnitrophota bacterium]